MFRAFFDALLYASLAAAAIGGAADAAQAATPLRTETGRFGDLIARLAGSDYVLGDPAVDARPYVDPEGSLNAFRHVAAAMAWGDIHDAARHAEELDYEIVRFVDDATQRRYYVLRENLRAGRISRGWGSYIINPDSRIDAVVEAPHPLADAQTPEIGAAVFVQSGARGYLLAGAHRLKADVPDLVDSVFHQVHTAWIGPAGRVAAWQIHGFASYKHSFPHGAHVIASTGDGGIAPEVASLDAICEDQGLTSYVFNDRPAESKANKRLNGDVPGVTFSALAATANEQGRLSRSLGGSFVHVELESRVRMDAVQAERASMVIAAAMSATLDRSLDGDGPAATLAAYAHEVDPVRIGAAVPEPIEETGQPTTRVAFAVGAESNAGQQERPPIAAEPIAGEPAVAATNEAAPEIARSNSPRPVRMDGARARRARKRDS